MLTGTGTECEAGQGEGMEGEGEGESVMGLYGRGLNPSATAAVKDESSRNSECFYHLCTKSTICGRFKNPRHALYCTLFSLSLACLLIAIIGPILLYKLGDYFINDQVLYI
jgi:hypothetical protein